MEQVTAATVDGLREALGALKLDTRGHKSVLKKRLRTAKKSLTTSPGNDGLKAASATQHIESWRPTRPSSQDFDSYCVLDFEATCQQYVVGQGSRFDFPNEVRSSLPPCSSSLPVERFVLITCTPFRSSSFLSYCYSGSTERTAKHRTALPKHRHRLPQAVYQAKTTLTRRAIPTTGN